jgi:glutamine cyclotransferase
MSDVDHSFEETASISIDGKYFGEGITIIHNLVYMLTYKAQKVLCFDLDDFDASVRNPRPLRTLDLP